MIQVITHCDRCHKMLDMNEGHAVQMWGKKVVEFSSGMRGSQLPVNFDICDGCYKMLDFFFVGRFRDEVVSA